MPIKLSWPNNVDNYTLIIHGRYAGFIPTEFINILFLTNSITFVMYQHTRIHNSFNVLKYKIKTSTSHCIQNQNSLKHIFTQLRRTNNFHYHSKWIDSFSPIVELVEDACNFFFSNKTKYLNKICVFTDLI